MVKQERPDAVTVAVPTVAHFSVAKELLEAGCHVLVEKPIASTLEEAYELIRVSERVGRMLMVGHIERFNPAVIELRRRLDTGELGRVYQIYARRLGPFPPRILDVGVVTDLATHDLDIMRYLTGSEVIRVYAEAKRELHTSHEDLFAGILRFKNGTIGLLEINWLTPTKIRELFVTGEKGMFRVDYITQDLFFYENAASNSGEWMAASLLPGVSVGKMIHYAIQKKEPLRAELEAFIASIQEKNPVFVNGYDAHIALALAKTLVASAWSYQVKEVNYDNNNREPTSYAIAPVGSN
jgi:predicted dehydrogenase